MSILTFQTELRPALPNVYGASDSREFRDQLSQIDHLLGKSGMEEELVVRALKRWEEEDLEGGEKPTEGQRQRQRRMLHYALRCNVARHLTSDAGTFKLCEAYESTEHSDDACASPEGFEKDTQAGVADHEEAGADDPETRRALP